MMSTEVWSNSIERKSFFCSIILCKKKLLSSLICGTKMSLPLLFDTPMYLLVSILIASEIQPLVLQQTNTQTYLFSYDLPYSRGNGSQIVRVLQYHLSIRTPPPSKPQVIFGPLNFQLEQFMISRYLTLKKIMFFLTCEPERIPCFFTFIPDQDHVFSTKGAKVEKS